MEAPLPPRLSWIPAFAGMTAGMPAIDASGTGAHAVGDNRWIPAFAGMTALDDQRLRVASKLPARQRGRAP